jgi:hypothetical protein
MSRFINVIQYDMDGVKAIHYRIFLKRTERTDMLVAGILIPHNTKPYKEDIMAYLMGKYG